MSPTTCCVFPHDSNLNRLNVDEDEYQMSSLTMSFDTDVKYYYLLSLSILQQCFPVEQHQKPMTVLGWCIVMYFRGC